MAHARFSAAHAAEDAALVRAGDSASLGLLFQRYRARLHAVALGMLGCRAEAEDAVHDTFVTAIVRLPQLADPQAVGGWLHTIVRNRCRMQLRGRATAPLAGDDAEALLDEHAAEACIEQAVAGAELRDWVWSALHRLSEVQRVVVLLRHFGSYDSYEEIAAILGVPVGTVRSRLAAARETLAEALLACAGRADDALLARQRRSADEMRGVVEALYRDDRAAFHERFAADLSLRWTGGPPLHGRAHLEADVDGDLRAGVRLEVTRVLASGDTTVLEARLHNPQSDPLHCPPGGAMVMFHGPAQVQRVYMHLAPRPPALDG